MGIHGIDAVAELKVVQTTGQYTLKLKSRFSDEIVVYHTAFDKNAMDMVAEDYGLDQLEVRWLDSTELFVGFTNFD